LIRGDYSHSILTRAHHSPYSHSILTRVKLYYRKDLAGDVLTAAGVPHPEDVTPSQAIPAVAAAVHAPRVSTSAPPHVEEPLRSSTQLRPPTNVQKFPAIAPRPPMNAQHPPIVLRPPNGYSSPYVRGF